MLDIIKKIYVTLPTHRLSFLKYLPDTLLYGKSYKLCHPAFDTRLILPNLFYALTYARDNTVFWSTKIPKDLRLENTLEIYAKLPTISSFDLANNLSDYTSKKFTKLSAYLATTGGTGRNPTSIMLSNESFGIEWAHIHKIWSEIGYSKKKHLKLTIVGKRLREAQLISQNPIYNELIVDFFKINDSNFDNFEHVLKNYQIDYLESYPSLIVEFLEYLRTRGVSITLKGIMLGSEGITTQQINDLSHYFQCPIVTWYGQSEKVILAYRRNTGGAFKVFTSYGYPDLIDQHSGFGEIIGTTFVNRALPLIRYRTGDYGKIFKKEDGLWLHEIQGRWGRDFIYLNEKKKIPTTAINLHSAIQSEILFYQLTPMPGIGHNEG